MRQISHRVWWTALAVAATVAVSHAQGRGGGAWTTMGGDAQRTSSVRTDPKISPDAMQRPGFQLLWKRKLDAGPLTQPLLLPNIIAYKGFKALAFVGSASGNVYSIDYDLNRMFWQQKLATSATRNLPCSSGMPVLTKLTAVAPAASGRGAGGFGGGGGRGRGGPGAPQIVPSGRGGADNVFAISTGGMVHVMNPQIGTDQIPPVKFLPPNANVTGSILIDTTLYAATTGRCGGVANGVWAIDLASEAKTVASFDTKGAGVAGSTPPTIGTDGTVYIATASGTSPAANSIVSLEAKTLAQKDAFSTAAPFTSNPIVFQYKGKDLVVAANKDGRLYVLDSASLGGADHKTALHRSSQLSTAMQDTTGLATWQDAESTRWIVVTSGGPIHSDTRAPMSNGAVSKGALVAFTLVDDNGAPTLQPQWVSRDLTGPLTPVAVNGVLFALASGETGARGSRATPAVLYALDAATGKELWSSGNTITSPVHRLGPSAGDSQVYIAASDGTLYVFGMPAER
jgi:outer membrane protein assembly factor BamB